MAEFDPDAYLAKEDKKTGFDPDAYLAKSKPTTTALKEQGKAFASLADTALNTITGGLDMAAYPLARAYYGTVGGLPADQAAAKAQQETTSPKDVFGRAFGYTGQQSYENNPARQLGNYVGQTMGENVIQPLAESTGLPEPDVANMVNWGTLAAAGPAGRVAKTTASTAGNVAKGALGSGFGYIARPSAQPRGYQIPSARTKLGNEFIEPESYAAWQRGEIPIEEMGNYPHTKPIQELPQNALERTALQLGGGTMPYKGQAAQAFGERLGETYRNPVTAAIDLGSAAFTGIPFYTAAKTALGGVRAAGDYLMSRKGFDPALPENLKFAREAQQTIEGMGGVSGPIVPPQTPPQSPQGGMPQTPPPGPAPQGGAPSMAAQTPAAQAAAATTQAKASKWGASANYDMNSGAGSVKIQTPLGPMNVKFGGNTVPEPNLGGAKSAPAQTTTTMPEQGRATPMPTEPFQAPVAKTAEQIAAENNAAKAAKQQAQQRKMEESVWSALQQRVANGGKLMPNEQAMVDNIIVKYGRDPFGTGSLDVGTPAPKIEPVVETPTTKPTPAQRAKRSAEEANDRKTWQYLQNKEELNPLHEAEVKRITEKYGEEPFGLGDINGEFADPNSKSVPYYRNIARDLKDLTHGVENREKIRGESKMPKDNPNTDPFQTKRTPYEIQEQMRERRNGPKGGRPLIGGIYVREVGSSAIKKSGKRLTIDEKAFNDLADKYGLPELDWDTIKKDLSDLPVAKVRKEVSKRVLQQFKPFYEPILERHKTMEQLDKKFEIPLTPEQQAAQDAIPIRTMDSNSRLNSILRGESFTPKTALKTETPKTEAPKTEAPKTEASKMIEEGKLKGAEGTDVNKILEMIKARKNKGNPPDVIKMETGQTIHKNIDEAANDFLQNQMTNNNNMLETSYYSGKNIVEEMKYPGYHKVEIKRPDGTSIVMKKHTIGDHTEYSRATMRGENPIPIDMESGLNKPPKDWMTVIDQIGKGK